MSGVLVDVAAEEALVGAVLEDDALWLQVGYLRPSDFGSETLGFAWEACRRLKSRSESVDVVTVVDELRAMGRMPDLAAQAYVMGLLAKVYRTVHAVDYAATVRDLSLKRQVQARAQALVAAAHDPHLSPDALLAQSQRAFHGLSAGVVDESGDADVWEFLDRQDAFLNGDGQLLPFLPHSLAGLRPDVDGKSITPGWPMSLGVLGGRSGEGKTSAAATEAIGWLFGLGLPGGIIGLEDGTRWLLQRLLARRLGIPFGLVGACRLREEQMVDLQAALAVWQPIMREKLRRWPKGGLDSQGLLAKVEEWIQWGARWIWIDHGLRVKYRSSGGRDRLDLAINETTEALAELAQPTRDRPGCAIIVNWHLNRTIEDEEPPKRDHFKEAGYLDANARYMLGLWKRAKSPGCRLFTGVKANFAAEGWTVEVPLDERSGLFRDDGARLLDFQAEREAAAEQAREEKEYSRKRMKLFPGGGG